MLPRHRADQPRTVIAWGNRYMDESCPAWRCPGCVLSGKSGLLALYLLHWIFSCQGAVRGQKITPSLISPPSEGVGPCFLIIFQYIF